MQPGAAAFRVRSYGPEDYEALLEIQRACFPPPYPEDQLWSRAQVESHAERFPEGALCVESGGGALVASCTSLIVSASGIAGHSWARVSGDGFITTHDPAGDTLYGIDIAVLPSWRRLGLSRLLYETRLALVATLGLARFQAAGRIPGYAEVSDSLTPEAYVDEVVKGRREDPVLTPQLRGGLRPVKVLRDYITDEESRDCAVLLEWSGPKTRPHGNASGGNSTGGNPGGNPGGGNGEVVR